jgi:DNA-binding NarL/FixJ family response regulator
MIALGWSNKEIANSLGLGVRTVEDHRAVIFGKLGVRNAVELTRKVLGVA